MLYHEAVVEFIKRNGPDQHYAFCTAFGEHKPEDRVGTHDLCRQELLQCARYRVLGIEHAGGRVWVMLGALVLLRPTPEYCRMTRVGVEEPYRWRFNENDLTDQVDEICTGDALRLVAGSRPDGTWGAFFSDRPGVPREERRRTPTFRAASLEAALWGAVRAYRRDPLPQRVGAH